MSDTPSNSGSNLVADLGHIFSRIDKGAPASLTIEQVVGRRKKMLLDMLPGVKAELREQLSREGRANSQGIEYLVSVLEVRLEERGTLAHEAEWYTCDERMQAALGELLQAKRELGCALTHPLLLPCSK